MSDLMIEVQPRETRGKNANRKIRAAGDVPAVVYGGGRDSVAIQLSRRDLLGLLRGTQHQNPIFLLKLGDTGKSRHAMIRDMEVDAVTREVLHVDFLRVLMTEQLKVSVEIEIVGTPHGVKTEGGMLDFVTREVEIECLPDKIPSSIKVDVEELHTGQHIEAKELELPEGVVLTDDPDKVIVSVMAARLEEETEDEDDDGLLEVVADEPELIGKGGDDEGEG